MAIHPPPYGTPIIFLCTCERRDYYCATRQGIFVVRFEHAAWAMWSRLPTDMRSNDRKCATGLGRAKTKARQLGLL